MNPAKKSLLRTAAIVLFAPAAAWSAGAAPVVPAALQPPADVSVYLEAFAKGVQIYECTKNDSAFEWKFTAPGATLVDGKGAVIGKHYAGPTWEGTNGSAVVGEVKAKDPGPTPTAVPWLLLSAKSHTGNGTFADAKFIQRVATVGGLAPKDGCSESTVGKKLQIPYSATYRFFK